MFRSRRTRLLIIVLLAAASAVIPVSTPRSRSTSQGSGTTGSAARPAPTAAPSASQSLRDPDRYVNCVLGSDVNPGTRTAPVRTIHHALATRLAPGDTVWLAKGCAWEGQVTVRGDGTAARPITIAAYGTGAAPSITGSSLSMDRSVVQLTGSYQSMSGVRVSHGAGIGISLNGGHDAVTDTEIADVGIGVRFRGRFGLANTVNVHDLHMVVDTAGGDDDYGAVGYDVEATDAEVSTSRCTNCRAPSHDFGYDGGFVEVWNHGDRLFVHDCTGDNTSGVLEIGGDAPDGSARNVTLARDVFRSAHGGLWIHSGDHFSIAVSKLLLDRSSIDDTSTADPQILGGDLTNLTVRNSSLRTPGQVSWSGSPSSHGCNRYFVPSAAAIGFPVNGSESVAGQNAPQALGPASPTCGGPA